MSRGVNRVSLLGNVGQDPDVRATSSGTPIAKFSLATNRTYKDAAGTKREETQWHKCTVWGKLADIAEQYVKKGDRLYVEGRIEYSESETDGQKKYWTDIIVTEMVMLGSTEALRVESRASEQYTNDDPERDLPF
jgi:single-strand DNA-binding protein